MNILIRFDNQANGMKLKLAEVNKSIAKKGSVYLDLKSLVRIKIMN